FLFFFFFSSRRRHTRSDRDWSSDVCSSDLATAGLQQLVTRRAHLRPARTSALTYVDFPAPGRSDSAVLIRSIISFTALRTASGRSEERRVGKECRFRVGL